MKHLKRFENFGRFENEEKDSELDNDFEDNEFEDFGNDIDTDEVCDVCGTTECGYDHGADKDEDDDYEDDEDDIKKWGDEEIVEKKKINAGFQAYLDKQKEKNSKKDKKEDDKEDKKETKTKGLTAKQKKLPEAMQKAILKRQK